MTSRDARTETARRIVEEAQRGGIGWMDNLTSAIAEALLRERREAWEAAAKAMCDRCRRHDPISHVAGSPMFVHADGLSGWRICYADSIRALAAAEER